MQEGGRDVEVSDRQTQANQIKHMIPGLSAEIEYVSRSYVIRSSNK